MKICEEAKRMTRYIYIHKLSLLFLVRASG